MYILEEQIIKLRESHFYPQQYIYTQQILQKQQRKTFHYLGTKAELYNLFANNGAKIQTARIHHKQLENQTYVEYLIFIEQLFEKLQRNIVIDKHHYHFSTNDQVLINKLKAEGYTIKSLENNTALIEHVPLETMWEFRDKWIAMWWDKEIINFRISPCFKPKRKETKPQLSLF